MLLLLWGAGLSSDFLKHVVTPQRLGDAFRFVFGQRMIRIGAGDLKQAIVQHHDAERAQRDARRDHDFIHVVDAEAAGLFDPLFEEWIAQGMLSLGFGEVCAFDNETIFEHGRRLIYHCAFVSPTKNRSYKTYRTYSTYYPSPSVLYRTRAYVRFNVCRSRAK